MRLRLLLTATLLVFAFAAGRASAAEPAILYPAKVTTMQGRIFHFANMGHELGVASFLYYDGETQGRVSWRDIDKVTFVGNLGHEIGAEGRRMPGTRRVRLVTVDGNERFVNLAIGHVTGHDGMTVRDLPSDDLAVIDFEESQIAPALYRSCPNGHVWEQPDYRFCPYDGRPLSDVPAPPQK